MVRTPTPQAMDDAMLKSVIGREIRQAVDWLNGEIGTDREQALDFYYGEPFGDETEGRSAVISTDVQDTIESIMPSMMEIFGGSDEVCSFDPVGQEDEGVAGQATAYVNYVWHSDNDGWSVIHDWIKDALLQKNGVIKIHWDDTPEYKKETMVDINSLRMQELANDDDIEILEVEEKPVPEDLAMFAPDGILYDVTVKRLVGNGRVRVEGLPPEEFLISRRTAKLDDARFLAHKVKKTRSDLLEMGFSKETIQAIPAGDDEEYSEERQARFADEEYLEGNDSLDWAAQEVWLYDCYMRVDSDGDGILEMRNILVAGPGHEVLSNEEVDEHPFCSLTPIKMPHKFFGRSIADLTIDVQRVKSAIQRQVLDNMYMTNNGRHGITNKVDLDDYLTNRPGGAVRIDSDAPDAGGHISPIVTQPLGPQALPLVEYWDSIRETRTGVTRYNQGMDAQALNKTASGINQILNQAAKRQLLIARTFAELGFRPAMRKTLKLLVNHQDRERVIRLRGEWKPMDPRSWNADMDVTINVGLGHGTKESQQVADQMMLQLMEKVIGLQQGVQGPFVKPDNVYAVLKRVAVNNGYPDPDVVWSDPSDPKNQPPPQQPNPLLQLEQAKIELEKHKSQGDLQIRAAESENRMKIEQMKAAAQLQMKSAEMEQDRAKFEAERSIDAAESQADRVLAQEKLMAEIAASREKLAAELELKAATMSAEIQMKWTELSAELAVERAKIQGDLAKAQMNAKTVPDVTVNLPGGKKTVQLDKDADGNITGATVNDGE